MLIYLVRSKELDFSYKIGHLLMKQHLDIPTGLLTQSLLILHISLTSAGRYTRINHNIIFRFNEILIIKYMFVINLFAKLFYSFSS